MTIKTINYQKVFPLAPYVNVRLGAEAELAVTDDPDACMNGLKQYIENWFNTNYPNIGEPSVINTNPSSPSSIDDGVNYEEREVVENVPKEKRIALLIKDIERETKLGGNGEAGGLMSWKLMVEKNPVLKEAFDNKLKQLTT